MRSGSGSNEHSEQDYLRLAQRARRMADEAVTAAVRASLLKMADQLASAVTALERCRSNHLDESLASEQFLWITRMLRKTPVAMRLERGRAPLSKKHWERRNGAEVLCDAIG
jgi:hypothetical protein